MATRFSIVHEFDCEPALHWELFFDEAFNVDQFARIQCERKLLSQRDEPERRLRDQEITPQRDVPGVLRKLLPSGALKYVERGVWKKPAGPLTVNVTVPAAGDRFAMTADYSVSPLPGGRCRREFAGECSVRVPLVAGMAEKAIIDNLRQTYDDAARVFNDWIARRKTAKS
jgi:hypothetical protein